MNVGQFNGSRHDPLSGKWYVQGYYHGQPQFLHKDGTWHSFPVHPDTNEWSGYFDTEEEARIIAAHVGPPVERYTRQLHKVCPKCKHLYRDTEQHECPTPEYTARRDKMVAEVAALLEAGLMPE